MIPRMMNPNTDSIAAKPSLWSCLRLAFQVVLMRMYTAIIIRREKDVHRAFANMTRLFPAGAPDSVPDAKVVDIVTKIIRSKAISRSRYCLRRSLILFALMQHRYTGVMINIGMDLNKPEASGHCWLTLNDALFLPDVGRDDKEVFPHRMGAKDKVVFWSK